MSEQLYKSADPLEVGAVRTWVLPIAVDYEAAMKVRNRLEWARHDCGPLAMVGGYVEINGVKVPRLSDYQETQMIVDAALGRQSNE